MNGAQLLVLAGALCIALQLVACSSSGTATTERNSIIESLRTASTTETERECFLRLRQSVCGARGSRYSYQLTLYREGTLVPLSNDLKTESLVGATIEVALLRGGEVEERVQHKLIHSDNISLLLGE